MLWWTFWWSRDVQPRDSYVDWLNHKFAVDICRRVTSSRFLTHFGTFTLTFSKIDELIRQSWRSEMHEMNVSYQIWASVESVLPTAFLMAKKLSNDWTILITQETSREERGSKKEPEEGEKNTKRKTSARLNTDRLFVEIFVNTLYYLIHYFFCHSLSPLLSCFGFLLMLSKSYRYRKHGTEGNDFCVGKCRREQSFSSWKVDISIPASLSFLAVPHRLDVDIQL